MDSNSDSSEMFWTKVEPDLENDQTESNHTNKRMCWTSDTTMKLINVLKRDCKVLWDTKNPLHKDRQARQTKLDYLAKLFGTTPEEITRKVHNLRTQFNNEMRKMKRRSGIREMGASGSGWEYFEALMFLQRSAPSSDPLETDMVDGVNLELAEFQANEEEKFNNRPRQTTNVPKMGRNVGLGRFEESTPRLSPTSAYPMMSFEDAVPLLRPSTFPDEYQVFGDFVASELRLLRSDESRRKLKRIIQKAIIEISYEEEANSSPVPLI